MCRIGPFPCKLIDKCILLLNISPCEEEKIRTIPLLELKQDRKDRILAIAGYTLYGYNYKLQIHIITLLLTHVVEFTISSLSLSLLIADHCYSISLHLYTVYFYSGTILFYKGMCCYDYIIDLVVSN
jgi:hypothetical protein